MQQETLQVSAKLTTMNTIKLLIAAALSTCSCSVFAQWQWVDETGHKVFSDRPPPAHIAPQNILKQPGSAPATSSRAIYPSTENSAPATPTAPTEKPPEKAVTAAQEAKAKQETDNAAHDKALEEAKRKAEELERKKQEAQQAKLRQENCQRARAAQTALQSGALISHVNEKGERGIMTEEQRQADLKRTQQIIKDNCK